VKLQSFTLPDLEEINIMVDNPKIVVGLGNPGVRYRDTRHNIGFLVVEELARRQKLGFSVERAEYLATGEVWGPKGLVLLKPMTYMNLSGEALVSWANRAQQELTGQSVVIPTSDDEDEIPAQETLDPIVPTGVRPLVICDDLALPLGAVRLRSKGSSGGQNGVESIIENLGGEEFPRLRLGIAPLDQPVDPEFWPDFVLSEFEPAELELVKNVVNHAADAVEFWLNNTLEQTTSRFNRRRGPS